MILCGVGGLRASLIAELEKATQEALEVAERIADSDDSWDDAVWDIVDEEEIT